MDSAAGKRLEVKISRWQSALAAIFCLGITVACVVFFFSMSDKADFTGQIGMTLLIPVFFLSALASTATVSLWLRRRPLFTIDDQGLTDYGFYSQGFGLIRWENIESLTPRWMGRSGLNLFMKVNNYDELLSQRNLLMQPLLMIGSGMNWFFGAQILLPVGWGDTDIDVISQAVYSFSKNKVSVPPPLGVLQSILPSLALTGVIILLGCAVIAVGRGVYLLLQHR